MMNWERYPEIVKIQISNKKSVCLAYVNWSDGDEMEIELTLSKEMLPEGCDEKDRFVVCDFYGRIHQVNVGVGASVKMSILKPHAATVIKIECVGDAPIIVESDGHYSMGAEIQTLEIKDGQLHVVYNNTFDYPVSYKVLLPKGYAAVDQSKYINIEVSGHSILDTMYPLTIVSE